MKLLIILDGSS